MNQDPPPFPVSMIRPRRKIHGISAILLPFSSTGQIAWGEFEAHVGRTVTAGLVPAVNMDTGYGHLISNEVKIEALKRTRSICGTGQFVAGAFVGDGPGAAFNEEEYARQIDMITSLAGIPVIFQSYGLTQQTDDEIVASYHCIAQHTDQFIGFELGTIFAPFGSIYSLNVYEGLLKIPQCIGAKHSSLDRSLEWQRILLRDRIRPEFRVFTGNDLAIDMVMYGSDYLLGLSTFAPDLFALRDRYWLEGNEQFFPLNDVLQYLGFYAFRTPVPAYKHSAAMFLRLRGWLSTSETHPQSPTRSKTDEEVLAHILAQLEPWMSISSSHSKPLV
jgi:dihydrodipicolinate synthase/N-acetylneuraminate lyase